MHEDPLIISLRKPSQPVAHRPLEMRAMKERQAIAPRTPIAPISRFEKQAVPRKTPRFVFILIGCVILAIIVGSFVTFLNNRTPSDPSHVTQADVDTLVARVGALILLPQGETPTIATVTDLNALSNQAFFAHASIGDKVLMYPKAQRAILYNPTANKVITDGPIVVDKK